MLTTRPNVDAGASETVRMATAARWKSSSRSIRCNRMIRVPLFRWILWTSSGRRRGRSRWLQTLRAWQGADVGPFLKLHGPLYFQAFDELLDGYRLTRRSYGHLSGNAQPGRSGRSARALQRNGIFEVR